MRTAALIAALTTSFALAACGGGGGPGSGASTAGAKAAGAAQSDTAAPQTAGAPPGQGLSGAPTPGGVSSVSPTLTPPSARAAARHRALARKAGRAAPFLVPAGDNSIPTYGGESSDIQRRGAEASLSAYLSARESGDWSGACSYMAATVQQQLAALARASEESAKGCPAAYVKLSSHVPATSRASVLVGPLAALRVEGDRAFALFYGPHEQQYMMPMVSEGGAWKVNQLEPVLWPIGAPTAGG